jgi:hypothetical protein
MRAAVPSAALGDRSADARAGGEIQQAPHARVARLEAARNPRRTAAQRARAGRADAAARRRRRPRRTRRGGARRPARTRRAGRPATPAHDALTISRTVHFGRRYWTARFLRWLHSSISTCPALGTNSPATSESAGFKPASPRSGSRSSATSTGRRSRCSSAASGSRGSRRSSAWRAGSEYHPARSSRASSRCPGGEPLVPPRAPSSSALTPIQSPGCGEIAVSPSPSWLLHPPQQSGPLSPLRGRRRLPPSPPALVRPAWSAAFGLHSVPALVSARDRAEEVGAVLHWVFRGAFR